MTRAPEQIINEQVLVWSQQQTIIGQGGKPSSFWPIITISREFGAQGAALAQVLAKRTGFAVWDKELVQEVAAGTGSDVRILRTLDEHRQKMIEDAVRGAMGRQYTNLQYLRSLMRVVHTVAAHGSSIIVGRGANYICKSTPLLRIRVVCPLERRIQGYAERQGIDRRQAQQIVAQKDADRADFIRRTFKKDVAEPSDYDLVLTSATYTLDQLADIVLVAYEARFGRRPDVSHVKVRIAPGYRTS